MLRITTLKCMMIKIKTYNNNIAEKRQKYYILGWYLPALANSNFISDPKPSSALRFKVFKWPVTSFVQSLSAVHSS